MTAQTSDVYSGNLRPEDSDELDLRRYVLVLLKWWREILAISVLTGAITGITLTWLSYNATPTYKAKADILIARLLSNIELDARVSTSIGANQGDQNGWRTSLLQLASSSVVANAVLGELQDDLPASFRSPEALLAMISATNPLSEDERFASNIIRISATSTNPEVSAMVANSWARHLVDYINGLYGEVPESMIESVIAEREQALLNYQAAEKSYEEFVANNQIAVLTRQIEEKSLLLNGMMTNYSALLTAVVNTDYTANITLYTTLASASVQHATALVTAQSAGTIKSLDRLYSLHASAIAQLNQARIMERSLTDGGEAAAKSNIAALQLLKLSTFATLYSEESLTANFSVINSVQDVEMTLEEQLIDVRTLVTVLEEHVAQLESDIIKLAESQMIGAAPTAIGGLRSAAGTQSETAEISPNPQSLESYRQLLSPDGVLNQGSVNIRSLVSDSHEEQLTTLEAEIRTLQAAVAAEEARQRELVHRRDLAWTTYETVGTKLQELNLLRSSANSEVRVGNPALVPHTPQPQDSPLRSIMAITMVGFILAVVLALLVDMMGGTPFFARRPA